MRLGREKALEKIGSQSLLERAIDCIYSLCQPLFVVTSQEQADLITSVELKGKVIVDLYPGSGALGGIYTGLASADSFYSVVIGCDMPFLNRDLLRYMIGVAPGFDSVVPKIDDMVEPLHAVYSKDCMSAIREMLDQGKLGISQLFSLIETRYVSKDEVAKFDPEFLSFFNVNTQDDLAKARELIKQREQCLTDRKEGF